MHYHLGQMAQMVMRLYYPKQLLLGDLKRKAQTEKVSTGRSKWSNSVSTRVFGVALAYPLVDN